MAAESHRDRDIIAFAKRTKRSRIAMGVTSLVVIALVTIFLLMYFGSKSIIM